MKYIYLLLGWLFFTLGVIGAFLPVLPTTIFMILALWAFSKSSEKLHAWLLSHKLFGPILHQWLTYHVIPISAKILAVTMIFLSMVIIFNYPLGFFIINILIEIILLIVIVYILSKPSHVPKDETLNKD